MLPRLLKGKYFLIYRAVNCGILSRSSIITIADSIYLLCASSSLDKSVWNDGKVWECKNRAKFVSRQDRITFRTRRILSEAKYSVWNVRFFPAIPRTLPIPISPRLSFKQLDVEYHTGKSSIHVIYSPKSLPNCTPQWRKRGTGLAPPEARPSTVPYLIQISKPLISLWGVRLSFVSSNCPAAFSFRVRS